MLALTGGALAVSPRRVRAQSLEKVRLAGVPSDDLTNVFYAVKSGAYQKAGLDVEVIATSSGTAATTATLGGAYEIAKASPIASMAAHLRGLPVAVLGTNTMWDARSPFNVLAVAADSPVKTGADLNGKIGASPALNDINQLCISAWVDRNGGDARTMKWVELPLSALPAALEEHRVDAACLLEPVLTAAKDSGKVRVLTPGFDAIARRFCIGLFMTNADWAAKHADVIRTWLKVTYEAGAYCMRTGPKRRR
jgi:NitT/TauT family transport system substrate-binding protein